MTRTARSITLAVCVATLGLLVGMQAKLDTHKTRYYMLHTDLPDDRVREAAQRITAMAEMYNDRTKGFAGSIRSRFDFYLYQNPQDYYAAGGAPGSGGVYIPSRKRLMAIAGPKDRPEAWQLIQHEGFHQFVDNVIGGDIPVWVNEGMAEYFGEAIYTGDGFTTGVFTPVRLARIHTWLNENRFMPLEQIMYISLDDWNRRLTHENYDQAFSMIYFLAHGDDGRYRKALNNFVRDASRTNDWMRAWEHHFGRGTRDFEKRWKAYWTNMSLDDIAQRRAEACVATITSFYARAFSQRQIFDDFDAFVTAARAGELRMHKDDWLPRSIIRTALREAAQYGRWTIEKRPGRYLVICTMDNGTRLLGEFKIQGRKIRAGSVNVKTISRD